MRKERINWLLILQAWTMLWVVIGHAPLGEPGEGPVWENALYNTAYSFHMCLFVLISGFLFYKTRISDPSWNYARMIVDKAGRLLIPMFFFTCIAFVLKYLFPGEVGRDVSLSAKEFVMAFVSPYNGPLREMWFILCIFTMFALMPLWRTILSNRILSIIALVALLALYYFYPKTEILNIGRSLHYAIWFMAGLLIARYDSVVETGKKYKWLLLLGGVLVYSAGFWAGPIFKASGGILVSFAVAFVLDKYLPKIFSSYRDYTYQIFLIGIFAQVAVRILYRRIPMPYFVAWLICALAGLYVPVLVSKLLQIVNSGFLLSLVGLKKQNNRNK